MDLVKRKRIRLPNADYSSIGTCFLTICTKDRQCLLSHIVGTGVPDGPRVGTGVPDGPKIQLTQYGKIASKYIDQLNHFYTNISVEHYVIMPNHIHMLISIKDSGPSRTPVPTKQNSVISRFVSTLKRFCNKEYGRNIWQYRSNDHIIRSREDYEKHVKYIYENPIRWRYDELYCEEL